jgi:hypothetical protein
MFRESTYLAGSPVLGAAQYSDGVLAVFLLQVIMLRLDTAATYHTFIQ